MTSIRKNKWHREPFSQFMDAQTKQALNQNKGQASSNCKRRQDKETIYVTYHVKINVTERERAGLPCRHARTGLAELGMVTHSPVLLLIEEHCSPISLSIIAGGRETASLLAPSFPLNQLFAFQPLLCLPLRRPASPSIRSEFRSSSTHLFSLHSPSLAYYSHLPLNNSLALCHINS
jgi:hypothetical protein